MASNQYDALRGDPMDPKDHPDRVMPDDDAGVEKWQAWLDKYHSIYRPKGTQMEARGSEKE